MEFFQQVHLKEKSIVLKFLSWLFTVALVGGCSLLFWHYLSARSVIRKPVHFNSVDDIPLPAGYKRQYLGTASFGAWLRKIPLKADRTVYLYNGEKKGNQDAQFAVLDVSVGSKDLQQCADAVIRLYAEYLYATRQFSKIAFHATDGTLMDYSSWTKGYRFILQQGRLKKQLTAAPAEGQAVFQQYLESVFSYAGTLSLSKELELVADPWEIKAGDVFIRGGSPGHAVIVVDIAVNGKGQKIFLLAQSYMPAQDIHILQHPGSTLSPWYSNAVSGKLLATPEWIFNWEELRRFPGTR